MHWLESVARYDRKPEHGFGGCWLARGGTFRGFGPRPGVIAHTFIFADESEESVVSRLSAAAREIPEHSFATLPGLNQGRERVVCDGERSLKRKIVSRANKEKIGVEHEEADVGREF